MHKSNHSKIYTADELIRYHKGLMAEQEMHKLEKTALEDQFLSDALDGYKLENDSKENLQKIINELNNYKDGNAKSIDIRKYFSFFSIAASILVIAIAAYFILQPEDSHKMILAKNEQKVIEKMELKQDATIQSSDYNTFAIDKNLITKNKSTLSRLNKINKPSIEKQPLIAPLSLSQDSVEIASERTTTSANVIKDQVKFLAINQDSSMQNTIAIADSKMIKAPAAIQQKDLEYNNKVEATSLNEVMVTTIGSRKSKKQNSWAVNKENKKNTAGYFQDFQPEDTRSSFLKFVKENKMNCVEEDGSTKKGKVILSFKINKDGYPVNIKVQQSLSESCNKEAIRLLNNGPKWTGKRNKNTVVEIEF